MKESKAIYVTKRDIRYELSKEYQLYDNKVREERASSPTPVRYDQKTQEVGCQYDCKRDNLICTCRNLATIRKRQEREIRYFGLPKQIYAYHGTRSFTDIGVGSVKALQRKKVKRIYLPETDDRGVGSSDLSSYFIRRTRQQRGNSYYEQKRTSSKCVGGILEYNTGCVMNEKLSPIVQTVSGSTSPRDSTYNRNIEIGSNTVVKSLTNTTTQVEETKREIEVKPEIKVEEIKPILIVKEEIKEMKNKTIDTIKSSVHKDKDADKDFSSDSLVQHVHNLENPSDYKPSRISMEPVDPMENKLEREYRRIFANKSKEGKTSNERSMADLKSTSTLKRRFEALRRGLAKKEDSKKNSIIVQDVTSPTSVPSRKDVSINSDPPSLEGRSYSNTKPYCPFPNIYSRDKSVYNPRISSHYRRSVTGRKERDSSQWSSRPDDEDSECQGVKGMFKLWGKKFNLEEDYYKKNPPTPRPSYDPPKEHPKKSEKKSEEPKLVIKDDIEEKKDGKRFFFFKKKNKYKEKPYKAKKGVTAGRCEVRDGLMIKIGAGGTSYVPEEVVKEPEAVPDDYDDIVRRAWLTKFMSHAIESRNSVQVRWNNKTYATSSSTVFELMDNVYKDTGVVFRSKSQVTVHSSYKSYTQHVNFVHQNIEAWMIPKTLTDKPKLLPKMRCKSNEDRKDNIEVRISDQKWFIDKSKAFSHKIEVVLHSKNMVKLNKEESSEYLRIDIPKGFFLDSSSDDNNKHTANQSSDEEVYKIVEYETGSDLKKDKTVRNFDIGDHKQNNIKVTVSVKESKDYDSQYLDSVIRQPVYKNVSFQGSKVYILKRCDVIGVGIITQRDLREKHKPILKIQDDYSDEESEHHALKTNPTKCQLAESYLQDFYRHCTPLGIDSYSWCVSDSHLKCCSENSRASYNNQGDGSKSCPNIYDDFQTATIMSSCGASSCSHCHVYEDAEKPPDKSCKWFGKFKKKKDGQPSNPEKRTLPKDSIEVFKRRRIYAASDKSKWACPEYGQNPQSGPPCPPCPPPPCAAQARPSCDSKGGTLIECPKIMKSCCRPIEPKPKKRTCKKHVSLPNCEAMNEMLAKRLANVVPSGILAFKGSGGCDVCKKKGYCPKHAKVIPKPSCEIPRAPCRDSCEKMKKPPCANSRTSCENPPPPSCPGSCPSSKKSSCPPSPQPKKAPTPPNCRKPASCPPTPPKKKSSSCPGSPRPPSCPSTPPCKKKQKSPCCTSPPPPPCMKPPSCPSTPTRSKKKQSSRPTSPAPCKKPPSCPSTPPCRRPPSAPSTPPCKRTPPRRSPPSTPPPCRRPPSAPSTPPCKRTPPRRSPPSTPPPCRKPRPCPSLPPSPSPCRKTPPRPSPPPSPPPCRRPPSCLSPPPSPPPCKRPPPCPSPPPSPPPCKRPPPCPSPPPSPPPCRRPPPSSSPPPSPPPCRRPRPCSSPPPSPPPCRRPPPCSSPPPSPPPCRRPPPCPSPPPSPPPCRKPPSCLSLPPTPPCRRPSCPPSPSVKKSSCPPNPPPCKKPPPCSTPPCLKKPPTCPPTPPPCKRSAPRSPPSCPHIPSCSPPPPSCPHSPPCPPPPPSCPHTPPCPPPPPSCPRSPPRPAPPPSCPHTPPCPPPSSCPHSPRCRPPPPPSPPPCPYSPACSTPPPCPYSPPRPPPCPYASPPKPCPYASPPKPCPYASPPKPCPYASPPKPCPYASPPPPCPYASPPPPCPYATPPSPPCPYSPPPPPCYRTPPPPCRKPPPCPYSPPCTPPPRPKCCRKSKPCPLSPPSCPASPPSCCSVDPDRCPALPPPCKKASMSICKKISPFFKKKPPCPASPPCKPTPCKASFCKALTCQPSPCQIKPSKKPLPLSPCQKFSTTSCSYGSLQHRTPDAPYIYSPVHPCSPEIDKPEKPGSPCGSPPCNKFHQKRKPPSDNCLNPPKNQINSRPPCEQCLTSTDDFPWPTKNQVSNQSSMTSFYENNNQKQKEEFSYGCTKKCPMMPKPPGYENNQPPKKECKKSCPNRQGSPRPPCMPEMTCPPPRPATPPGEPRRSPSCPSNATRCKSKSKMSGLFLKMKPGSGKKKSVCSKDCLAWDSEPQEDGCISLNSEEKITIRLKKDTPSTEEIREGLNIKVQDEDGMTLFERKDYRLQHAGCSMHRPSVLGDMYKASEVRRVETTNSVQDLDDNNRHKQITEAKSDASIANLIEIQFKLKVTQGEKTTEINIANDGDKENEEDEKIEIIEPVNKNPQEVFVVKDGREPVAHQDPKNDINIRIVIKNFKSKSGKKKSVNLKHEDYGKDFAKKISAKFHTVSTGYSDVLHDDNVFSVHRATVDLTSSVDKSKTHSNRSEEIMSETLTGHGKGRSAPSICRCVMTDMSDSKIDYEDLKSIPSRKYSTNRETQEETDTDKPTHKYDTTEETDSDKQTDHKYDTEETDQDKMPENKYDTETDTEKHTAPKYDTFLSTDTDDQEPIPEEDTYIEKPKSIEVIIKPHTKDEKKEMLKQVFEKAHETKTKNKTRMRKLRDMLKVILTSDSSEHDESKSARQNDLAKDVTYASLKPNYFRDSDSMNNYYRAESHIKLSGEINTQVVYPSVENNSDCSNSNPSDALSSENESSHVARACMCSTLAARLKLASRIGDGGGCCCGTKNVSKKNEETTCDLKKESDYYQYEYKQEYVDVETQNSNYLISKINSTNLSTNKSMKSSIVGDLDTKTDSGVINVDEQKFNALNMTLSPHLNHKRDYEMRKFNRNTILSISDDDKIVLLSSKPTRVSAECAKCKIKERKKKYKEPIAMLRASDILQSYETKKAVLEIYTEKTISNDGEHLVAKLPKFVYDRENEIQTNYEAIANADNAVCKRNIVMMAINR